MVNFSIKYCVYYLLFSFWTAVALSLKISSSKGLSLMNLGVYLTLLIWAVVIVKRKNFSNIVQFINTFQFLYL